MTVSPHWLLNLGKASGGRKEEKEREREGERDT